MTEHIVYCNCTYAKVIEADVKQSVLSRLSATGKEFIAVPDLCEMAAKKDPQLAEIFSAEKVSLIACYHRAVKGLCHSAGIEWQDEAVDVINMRESSAAEIMEQIGFSEGVQS